ncbi:uncharacterized protein LOC134820911 [Bolinopsis microptera]|uniref:uncharacterized protein LOC134820911 n=1 Tax=Bolinopsis microptera TaxID=2820187 RepID=UPI00307A8745
MLDVFTLTPTDREVTTEVDQKLTCSISGLTPNEPAAVVTWTDPDDVIVTLSNEEYSISQGTVDSTGTQVAELTITPVKLGTLAVTSTYKCSAQSGKYPTSPFSPSQGVLVTVLSIVSQSTGSEVLAGQEAIISCAFTGITQQLDSITWLRSDGTLVSFLDNFEVEVGDYNKADNSQVTTLTVLGAENSADNIYICQYTSVEWARVDDRGTTVPINVFAVLPRGEEFSFAVTPSGEEISTATPQTISCDISGLSAPADIIWIKPDGIEVEKDDTANYLVEDGRDTFVEDGGFQTTKLTLKVPVVEKASSVVTYRCSVQSEEFSKSPAFSTDVVIERKTYTITGASRDVLAGSVATLTCSVTGSSVAEMGIVWVEENGNVYAASNINTDNKVKERIVGENSKESTLKLSKKVTVNKDQIFKCRVTLEEGTDPVEIEVPLKTFTVTTFGVEIQSGQPATLTCKVIEPTDTLEVTWYYDDGLEIGAGTQETISDNTIVAKLTLEFPRNDANYTCRVTGEYRYEFYAEVLIDDIVLNPAGEIRSLTGSEVILTCSFISETISEGFFQWKHNEEKCTTAACLSPTETPILSMVKITVEDGTTGEWKCSFVKAKNSREVKSEAVTITKVELSGTQTPASLWGLVGSEAEVSCVVPYGLTFSKLTPDNIEWIFNRYAISEQGVGLNQNNEVSFFSFGEKVTSATSLTWSITFSHTDTSVGSLKCRATYDSGEQIETSPSYLNLITSSSDVESIVITPTTGAVVTFITQAKVSPTSSIVMTSGNFQIQSTEEEAICRWYTFHGSC